MENQFETAETQEAARPAPAEARALRLPLALTMIALLIWFGFQTVALVFERGQLSAVNSNYAAGMQEAQKMQAQLQAVITQTADLANKGNPNAKIVLQELEKRGIPLASAAPPAK
ncbi:MAG TPA: hypothetical protein VGA73_02110 [Candidatus Binatia bacterium]